MATIVFALKTWRHYLYGVNCEIYTDHKELEVHLSVKGLEFEAEKMVRIIERL